MTVPCISAKNLSKCYGKKQAVSELSFDIPAGSIVGLIGPNGAGKSTTLKLLSGLIQPSTGSSHIAGYCLRTQTKEAQRNIAFLPEDPFLPPHVRGIEYLKYRAHLKGIPYKKRNPQIEKALSACNIGRGSLKKMIASLSKGFQQRLCIADALLGEPKVLLWDEPMIGLDIHQTSSMRKLLQTLAAQGTTILFSSHLLAEIELWCASFIILNQGFLVAKGTLRELAEQLLPKNDRNNLKLEAIFMAAMQHAFPKPIGLSS